MRGMVGAGLGALALILGAAVVGKIAGGAAGARIAGHPWSVSFAVGSLMLAAGLLCDPLRYFQSR